MLKKKLLTAVIAAITSCSLAVTAFAYPWDDPENPNFPENPYLGTETSEPTTEEPSNGTEEPPYNTEEPPNTTDEPTPPTTEEPPVTSEPPAPPPPEMTLDFYETTLVIGEGVQLYWTITNSIWENPAVGYESSDVSVVRVDNNGYIMAVGEGTAYVTAFYDSVSAYATITVVQPEIVPEFLVLKQKTFELKIGAAAQIEAQLLPEEVAEGYTITYETDNPDIAIVNERGLITALKTGTATITVRGAGLTEYVTVTVTSDVAYDTAKMDGYLYDTEGNPVVGAQLVIDTLKAVTDTRGYFSFEQVDQRELTVLIAGDDKAVCSIAPQGDTTVYLLYRKGSPLTRLSSYEELVGHLPINSVSFVSGANVILTAGETFELAYQYKPKDVAVTEIMYETSNEIVAEVGQIDGVIIAKAPGETDITVTLNGGQAQASCHIVVNPKESSEHSVLIVVIETILIAIAGFILIMIYKSYRKKLTRDLEKYDEEEYGYDDDE